MAKHLIDTDLYIDLIQSGTLILARRGFLNVQREGIFKIAPLYAFAIAKTWGVALMEPIPSQSRENNFVEPQLIEGSQLSALPPALPGI